MINNIASYTVNPMQSKNKTQMSFGTARIIKGNGEVLLNATEEYGKLIDLIDHLMIPQSREKGLEIAVKDGTFSTEAFKDITPISVKGEIYKCRLRKTGETILMRMDRKGLKQVFMDITPVGIKNGAYKCIMNTSGDTLSVTPEKNGLDALVEYGLFDNEGKLKSGLQIVANYSHNSKWDEVLDGNLRNAENDKNLKKEMQKIYDLFFENIKKLFKSNQEK